MRRGAWLVAIALALPSAAWAGAWTPDQGHFYLNASYSRIDTNRYYGPDFRIEPILPYTQQIVGIYAEVGIITRWLTATLDGALYRRNSISHQGYTEGAGDWRLGLWTGLLTAPVRLGLGVTLGIPVGDRSPSAGSGADADARQIAASLPTGDGEWDVDARIALGYSFGGARRWPLRHFLLAEAGYWLRTRGFSDAFVYKLQLGIQLPWKFVDRFWLLLRLDGVESFAGAQEAARDATGLGNGVSYTAPGVDLYVRIWRGLGASIGASWALRARSVAAGVQVKTAISYQW